MASTDTMPFEDTRTIMMKNRLNIPVVPKIAWFQFQNWFFKNSKII